MLLHESIPTTATLAKLALAAAAVLEPEDKFSTKDSVVSKYKNTGQCEALVEEYNRSKVCLRRGHYISKTKKWQGRASEGCPGIGESHNPSEKTRRNTHKANPTLDRVWLHVHSEE
jgi:hypothetical protein